MKITKSLFLIFLIFSIGNCYAGWFGPSNYEECILEKMKEAKSNYAAASIAAACNSKFPKKEPVVARDAPPQELPSEVLGQLILECRGRSRRTAESDVPPLDFLHPYARVDRDGPQCSLYNGNSEWTVSSLIIRIRELSSGKQLDFDKLTVHCGYPCTGVQPLSMAKEPIYLDLSLFSRGMSTGDISVFIVSGKGYKKIAGPR